MDSTNPADIGLQLRQIANYLGRIQCYVNWCTIRHEQLDARKQELRKELHEHLRLGDSVEHITSVAMHILACDRACEEILAYTRELGRDAVALVEKRAALKDALTVKTPGERADQ